jgi:ABC-type lipoprotein export system ATPase subunit
MALLEVRNATKLYATEGEPVAALRDISLTVDAGEFIALVGRSGCGKSTLLNLCGAMDFPTSGEILIDGQPTSHLSDAQLTRARREKVGFIFQSFQLIHTLTAAENVELPLLLARKPNARAAALKRLRWVEMDAYAGRLPHQLSGGQQQRIAIARALVHNPRLLLADEPTGNLDTVTGDLVLQLLRRSAHQFGVAIVMATHSTESTAATDRIFKMRDGRMDN